MTQKKQANKISQYIVYIHDNINELKMSYRKEILQMLMYAVDDEKIIEKGNGTQIKFSDINENLLLSIYNYIHNKIEFSDELI